MKATRQKGERMANKRAGFVLMEVLLAMAILASVSTAFAVALSRVAELSETGRRESEIQRILDSALTDAAMLPAIEPERFSYRLEEMGGIEIIVLIEPIEGLESMQGQQVTGLLRVEVTAIFEQDGRPVERMVETWRNIRLYQS